MKKISLFILLGIVLISCNSNKKTKSEPINQTEILNDSLTAKLDSIQKNGQLIGFGVSIVNEKGTLYEKGFGYSNIETKEKYTEFTLQHIASVSKTLIGVGLMKAKELGKINLDDPINKYLSFKVVNPFYPNQPITVRHLATHTSGINDTNQYMEKSWVITENQDLTNVNIGYDEQRLNPWKKNIPMEEYLIGYLIENGAHYQKDNYINFKPGERYNYSNIGATLAALIIEKVTGKSFDSFTEEHILKPLRMNTTGWSLKDIDVSKHSRLYRNDNTVLPFYTAITYPDGMLISSSSDMAKYLTELILGFSGEGTLLDKESYKELFTKQLSAENFAEGDRKAKNPYSEDYDPAIFIGHSALGYVGHSGGDAGVASWFYFNKETKTGRYLIINMDMGNDDGAKLNEYFKIYEVMDEYLERINNSK